MTKVSTYLQSHIAGEVSTRSDVREAMSTDGGILKISPELVIYPRTANDIRKVARFSWQLAEKGHPLAITARGGGTDASGAAIGKGIILDVARHMDSVFEYDPKQLLVRLQPGASISALTQALRLQDSEVRALRHSHLHGTVGGAIASAVCGPYANAHTLLDALSQLEVVLANGDVLQTERVSSRELNRRKGKEGMVGDVYRGIDGIIEEYADVISSLTPGDFTGYNAIADVKRRDGSFDLTPLFIGSQGTLGIISEMIMKVQTRPAHSLSAVLTFTSREKARDALDVLQALHPQLLEYFDGAFFEQATKVGKVYDFYPSEGDKPSSVVIIGFEDDSERFIKKSLKKLKKTLASGTDTTLTILDEESAVDVATLLDVVEYTISPEHPEQSAPTVYTGFHVPLTNLETFMQELDKIAEKEHIALPLIGHIATGIYGVYPTLSLRKVGDKQKALKLIDEIATLVYAHDGILVAEGGEGILKSRIVRSKSDDRLVEMYDAIRKVFDPHGTLNPGVKQDVDLKTLASHLRG